MFEHFDEMGLADILGTVLCSTAETSRIPVGLPLRVFRRYSATPSDNFELSFDHRCAGSPRRHPIPGHQFHEGAAHI